MHASELWHSPSVSARLGRAALLPASFLYAAGWQTYLWTYCLGLKRPKEPHCPVVCVGNLQVGGSGKTPLTLALAQRFTEAGREVVVSCSGYGSPRSEDASLAPTGQLSAAEWGDEPAMIRWLWPELDLVVGRNRVTAARLVHESRPNALMLMDDGFQHLPLRKHLTIVLDPPAPDNRYCLPAGPYREPRFNRNRADLVAPGSLEFRYLPTRLVTPEGEACPTPDRYSVLCALGSPQKFVESLKQYCAPRGGFGPIKLLPDHAPLAQGSILESFPGAVPIVVTAKDWVKLRERSDCSNHEFLIAAQTLELENFEIVENALRQRLGR